MHTFTIVIPVKPGGVVRALVPLRQIDYPPQLFEVLIAEGRQPSRQRNLAAAGALGDILYFLDDDSAVRPDCLTRLNEHYSRGDIVAVGGPSLTPAGDTPLQRAVGVALGSRLGGGGVRNRYRQTGEVRRTDDRELILCNLSFRRDVFLAAGGLDERLYPNEENELMDRLLASHRTLLHDPGLAVCRSQRPTLKAFCRQIFGYGRGRAEQTLLSRRINLGSLLPAFFVIYLCLLPLVRMPLALLPLSAYAALVCAYAMSSGQPGIFARLLVILPLLHICYGIGFLAGLCRPRFRSAPAAPAEVSIKIVKPMGALW